MATNTKRLTHIRLKGSEVPLEDVLIAQYNRANRRTYSSVNLDAAGDYMYAYYVEVINQDGGNVITVYGVEAQKLLKVEQEVETSPNIAKKVEETLQGMRSSSYLAEKGTKFEYGCVPTDYVGTPIGVVMQADPGITASLEQAITWYNTIYVDNTELKIDCKVLH